HLHHPGGTRERCGSRAARGLQAVVSKAASVRVPASSANLGPGFDVLALALDLHLEVAAREAPTTTIEWTGEGLGELPLNRRNLIVRAAQEPFAGWSRPLAVVFVPDEVSPTHEARRLVPRRPLREDAVFNLGRVAEWVLACAHRDRSLLRSAMDDRLHQPGRARVYPYLDDTIAAAEQAGA